MNHGVFPYAAVIVYNGTLFPCFCDVPGTPKTLLSLLFPSIVQNDFLNVGGVLVWKEGHLRRCFKVSKERT